MAFSPPESSSTFCSRFPGGDATMSIPASPELSGSVNRISAMPPPKIAWNASEKLLLIEFHDGLLRVGHRFQQIIAFSRQGREPLLALVEFLERHHVDRSHILDPLLHLAIVRFRSG